jgi:hypothetical protein
MTEDQARYIRKLKVDQNCSYQTIARMFYQENGTTTHCSSPESVLLHNLDVDPPAVVHHRLSDGDIPYKKYRVIEHLFSVSAGQSLCTAARKELKEDITAGWSDMSYDVFEESQNA